MSNQPDEITTIIVAIALPVLMLLAYPVGVFPVQWWVDIAVVLLGLYGIQAVYKLKRLLAESNARDLFPGYFTDKELVGLVAVFCIVFLTAIPPVGVGMSYMQAYTLIVMILTSIGFMRLSKP